MAIEGTLKVTPEQLRSASGEFASTGNQVQNLTSEMVSKVIALNNTWQGEAAMAYTNKFKSLQDDIDKMIGMIREHSQDLDQMAVQYENAEKINAEAAASLQDNVIS